MSVTSLALEESALWGVSLFLLVVGSVLWRRRQTLGTGAAISGDSGDSGHCLLLLWRPMVGVRLRSFACSKIPPVREHQS